MLDLSSGRLAGNRQSAGTVQAGGTGCAAPLAGPEGQRTQFLDVCRPRLVEAPGSSVAEVAVEACLQVTAIDQDRIADRRVQQQNVHLCFEQMSRPASDAGGPAEVCLVAVAAAVAADQLDKD